MTERIRMAAGNWRVPDVAERQVELEGEGIGDAAARREEMRDGLLELAAAGERDAFAEFGFGRGLARPACLSALARASAASHRAASSDRHELRFETRYFHLPSPSTMRNVSIARAGSQSAPRRRPVGASAPPGNRPWLPVPSPAPSSDRERKESCRLPV